MSYPVAQAVPVGTFPPLPPYQHADLPPSSSVKIAYSQQNAETNATGTPPPYEPIFPDYADRIRSFLNQHDFPTGTRCIEYFRFYLMLLYTLSR